MKQIAEFLDNAGITPTPVRVLVYRCLKDSESPLSLADIENSLITVDKSTVSRTLTILKKHDLVHAFNDGSGSVKYEICKRVHSHHHDDFHVHFHCEICGKTLCLNDVAIPSVKLPEGYEVRDANYVITGCCSDCANKTQR